jgi:membrane protease YdiL (CAAX protease family)
MMKNWGVRALDVALWAAPLLLCLAIAGIGALFALAVVIVALVARREARAGALPLWWRGALGSLALGVGVGVAIYAAMGAFIQAALELVFGGEPDLSVWDAVRGNLSAYLQMMALGLIFGGIAEELIFRGFVIGWGARMFGAAWALPLAALSAAVFGLSHLYQGWAGAASTGLIGLMIGVLYVACGRKLAPAILAHMTVNAFGITELYVGHAFVDSMLAR